MSNMLSPIISLMNRLTYPKKFALIAAVMAIPLIVLSGMLLSEINASIAFDEQERLGMQYVKALRPIMMHLPQHRGMMNAMLNGNNALRADLLKNREQIEKDIQAMDTANATLGKTLKIEPKWQSFKSHWQDFKAQLDSVDAASSFRIHTALIEELSTLLADVGDASSLNLDPDLDSYYLIQVAINQLPAAAEAIAQMRGLGSGVASRSAMTDQERVRLVFQSTVAQANVQSIKRGVMVATSYNDGLKATLVASLQAVEQAIGHFDSLTTNALLDPKTISINASDYFAQGTQTLETLSAFDDAVIPQLENVLDDRAAKLKNKRSAIILLGAAVILIAMALFFGFYLSVNNAVSSLVETSCKLAQGDLTARANVQSHDEIGQLATSFNGMAESFTEVISGAVQSANQVASMSTSVAASSLQLSKAVQSQSDAVSESAAAIEQMSVSIAHVADMAGEADEFSHTSEQLAKDGEKNVKTVLSDVENIAISVAGLAETVQSLGTRSEEISNVIHVIREIAEQTNLLALNAAIEAARAGEQGRGFSVVADEVRKLAERTATATGEITTIINGIQSQISNAVNGMETGRKQVAEVVHIAGQAGDSLSQINQSALGTQQHVRSIASAIREQKMASQTIASNVERIASRAEEQQSATENTTAVAKELERLADALRVSVSRFKISV